MIVFQIDQFPDVHPAFDLHDLLNTPQTTEKLKDRLRELVADPGNVPGDEHTQKYAVLKADIEGTDIGEL